MTLKCNHINLFRRTFVSNLMLFLFLLNSCHVTIRVFHGFKKVVIFFDSCHC